MADAAGLIRIGELSRRCGVSTDRLRAWEHRYGLLRPVRTAGGYRLYTGEDEARVREMQRQLGTGLAAAQAAATVLAMPRLAPAPAPDERDLLAALIGFDAHGAHGALEDSISRLGPDAALDRVIFPTLRELGERWARGELLVGQEHFASSLILARLLDLLRAPAPAAAPRALLACVSGEQHTLGLVGFGIALRTRGCDVVYLGADTPLSSVREASRRIDAAIIVLAATMPGRFAAVLDELAELATTARVAVGGPDATRAVADRTGAQLLDADALAAARDVAGAIASAAGGS